MYQFNPAIFRKSDSDNRAISQGHGGLANPVGSTNNRPDESLDLGFLLRALPVGVVVINTDGKVEYSNQKAQSIFQHTLNNYDWATIVSDVVRPQPDDGCEVTLRNGLKVRVDTQPLPNVRGQLLVVSDLTETRRMQSLVSHHKRLSDLGKMVAALAHQIRTPITTATLYAHQLAKPINDDLYVNSYATKLITQLSNVEKQVKDMLAYAQTEQPMNDSIDVDILPDLVVEPLEDFARSKHISLRIAAFDKSQICIRGNLSLLVSVLSNLVMNAIEASSKGDNVTVGVLSDQDKVRFYVSDTGEGIAFDHLQRIFDPFFTTKPTGTGLGLSVAKRVIEQHGGKFSVESEIGVGTTMVVTFKRQNSKERGLNEQFECLVS